jgi:pSer/pThr/pTyr-binding forkhead associated (FHA) protein
MKLRVVKGVSPGKEFEIVDGTNLLGRSFDAQECHIIDLSDEDTDEKISRRHAVIEKNGALITIKDLGSLNGTYVNSTDRLSEGAEVDLQEGDKIILGRTALVVTK